MTPLVAFVRAAVADSELREIEAFDAAGRRYLLDAQVEPMFPVVVVDLNERTDRNGYLRREFVQPAALGNGPETKLMDPNDPADPGSDVPYEPTSPSTQ